MGQETSLPPKRRSFRERLEAAPAGQAHDSARGVQSSLSQTASHPLTETSMTSVGGMHAFDTALRVNGTGEIRLDDHVARVSMGATSAAREVLPLPVELGLANHLFCVGASVEDDELEALAVSAWDEAHWVAPGRLHLRGGVQLSGPWALPVNVRGPLGLGADLTHAWVVECEPMRGEPAPPELAEALAEAFPETIDSRELVADAQGEPSRQSRRDAEAERELRSVVHELSDELREALARDREHALSAEQVVDGFALLSPIGNQSIMMVEVHQVERVPHVLRWEEWAQGAVIEYRLRWLPKGNVEVPESIVTRSERLERMRSTRDIESAATIILGIAGGAVVDEDDFLVSL